MIVEKKNSLKNNKIGHFKIKNYKFEKVEHLNIWALYLMKITISKQTCKKE